MRNRFETGKLFAEYELNPSFTVEAGVDYRRFRYNSSEQRRNAGELVTQTLTPQQVADLSYVFSGFGKGLNIEEGVQTSWLTPDLDAFAGAFDIYCDCGIYELGGVENSSARGNNEAVQEETWGACGQLDFNLDFGLVLRGNAGVRYFHTEQNGTAFAAVGTDFQQVTANRSCDMFLPSFNLGAEITPDLIARFAAARTIARPALGSISPGRQCERAGREPEFLHR